VFSLDIGGLERVVANLCVAGKRQGISFHLGCLSHLGKLGEGLPTAGAWIGKLPPNSGVIHLGVFNSLRHFIRDNAVQLIHSHNTKSFLYGTLAAHLTGVAHIQTVHGRGSFLLCPDQRQQDFLRKVLTPFTNKVVAVSEDVQKKLLMVDRLSPRKVVTIVNGIDTDLHHPAVSIDEKHAFRSRLGLPPTAFVVGTVGRLVAEKNYPLLVRAFAAFHRMQTESYLVFVADGPLRSEIEQSITKAGMSGCCHITGMQTAVSDWYRAMDVFVLSSDTEGLPMTLLEAMASGLPCVVTDVGGNRGAIPDDSCGFVVPAGNAQALTNAFTRLSLSAAERTAIGAAARQRAVQNYSVDYMLECYRALYEEFISKGKR
jgi:glycosyltransferase involved in cell wall biosynthesis